MDSSRITPKRIALLGHCGPDASYLIVNVRRALANAQVTLIEDQEHLDALLKDDVVDLVLVNRELHYGFADAMGVDLIRRLRASHPALKLMLVSNYREAHAEAVNAGALDGFGKRELGTPRVTELLRDAMK